MRNPEHYSDSDAQYDHFDSMGQFDAATIREMIGSDLAGSEDFSAVGESDSTRIPQTVEDVPLSSLASSALHVIEATPYRSALKRDGPEIARLVGRGQITAEESDVLFAAIKRRRAELTGKPKEM